MTRALDDKTSTCGSCAYWEHHPDADGIHPTRLGHCGWLSLPAWAQKYIPISHATRMREDEGSNCWLHTKREALNGVGNAYAIFGWLTSDERFIGLPERAEAYRKGGGKLTTLYTPSTGTAVPSQGNPQ